MGGFPPLLASGDQNDRSQGATLLADLGASIAHGRATSYEIFYLDGNHREIETIEFSAAEFTAPRTAEALLAAISPTTHRITLTTANTPLEKLNAILRIPNLIELLSITIAPAAANAPETEVQRLVRFTQTYRNPTANFVNLTAYQQANIQTLNRLVLEQTFRTACPQLNPLLTLRPLADMDYPLDGNDDCFDLDFDCNNEERLTFSETVAYALMRESLWGDAQAEEYFHRISLWFTYNLQRQNVPFVWVCQEYNDLGGCDTWGTAPVPEEYRHDPLPFWRWAPGLNYENTQGGIIAFNMPGLANRSGLDAASDDIEIPVAYVFAHLRGWDRGQGYLEGAEEMTSAAWESYVGYRGRTPFFYAGDQFRDSGDLNPSYFRPGYFSHILPLIDQNPDHDWATLAETSYEVLESSTTMEMHGYEGNLPPNWVGMNFRGEYDTSGAFFLGDEMLGWDAIRIFPMVLATADSWFDDPRARAYLRNPAGPLGELRAILQRDNRLLGGYHHDSSPVAYVAQISQTHGLNTEQIGAYGCYAALFHFGGDRSSRNAVLQRIEGYRLCYTIDTTHQPVVPNQVTCPTNAVGYRSASEPINLFWGRTFTGNLQDYYNNYLAWFSLFAITQPFPSVLRDGLERLRAERISTEREMEIEPIDTRLGRIVGIDNRPKLDRENLVDNLSLDHMRDALEVIVNPPPVTTETQVSQATATSTMVKPGHFLGRINSLNGEDIIEALIELGFIDRQTKELTMGFFTITPEIFVDRLATNTLCWWLTEREGRAVFNILESIAQEEPEISLQMSLELSSHYLSRDCQPMLDCYPQLARLDAVDQDYRLTRPIVRASDFTDSLSRRGTEIITNLRTCGFLNSNNEIDFDFSRVNVSVFRSRFRFTQAGQRLNLTDRNLETIYNRLHEILTQYQGTAGESNFRLAGYFDNLSEYLNNSVILLAAFAQRASEEDLEEEVAIGIQYCGELRQLINRQTEQLYTPHSFSRAILDLTEAQLRAQTKRTDDLSFYQTGIEQARQAIHTLLDVDLQDGRPDYYSITMALITIGDLYLRMYEVTERAGAPDRYYIDRAIEFYGPVSQINFDPAANQGLTVAAFPELGNEAVNIQASPDEIRQAILFNFLGRLTPAQASDDPESALAEAIENSSNRGININREQVSEAMQAFNYGLRGIAGMRILSAESRRQGERSLREVLSQSIYANQAIADLELGSIEEDENEDYYLAAGRITRADNYLFLADRLRYYLWTYPEVSLRIDQELVGNFEIYLNPATSDFDRRAAERAIFARLDSLPHTLIAGRALSVSQDITGLAVQTNTSDAEYQTSREQLIASLEPPVANQPNLLASTGGIIEFLANDLDQNYLQPDKQETIINLATNTLAAFILAPTNDSSLQVYQENVSDLLYDIRENLGDLNGIINYNTVVDQTLRSMASYHLTSTLPQASQHQAVELLIRVVLAQARLDETNSIDTTRMRTNTEAVLASLRNMLTAITPALSTPGSRDDIRLVSINSFLRRTTRIRLLSLHENLISRARILYQQVPTNFKYLYAVAQTKLAEAAIRTTDPMQRFIGREHPHLARLYTDPIMAQHPIPEEEHLGIQQDYITAVLLVSQATRFVPSTTGRGRQQVEQITSPESLAEAERLLNRVIANSPQLNPPYDKYFTMMANLKLAEIEIRQAILGAQSARSGERQRQVNRADVQSAINRIFDLLRLFNTLNPGDFQEMAWHPYSFLAELFHELATTLFMVRDRGAALRYARIALVMCYLSNSPYDQDTRAEVISIAFEDANLAALNSQLSATQGRSID